MFAEFNRQIRAQSKLEKQMQVLVLGGGTVGGYIAKRLSEQRHDVTVVESRRELCQELDLNDVRVLCGNALHASVLFQAAATTADVCFALTGSDETNLLAGSVARAMGARRVGARVNSIEFRDFTSFDYRRHFLIDRFMTQDYLTAIEIASRIREPGAMLIEHFANGELELQDVLITRESSLTGRPLSDLKLSSDVRVGAITRDGLSKIATAADKISLGNRVALMGTRAQVERVKKTLLTGSALRPYVLIAGGGEIGLNTARILCHRGYDVKIFERNLERCNYLARQFGNAATIVHGDGRRRATLDEQGADKADFFIACAGDDENNIMACVEALELGTRKCVAVVKHGDYAGIVSKLGVSEAVSPYDVMARQAEGFMHVGALVFQNSRILNGDVEVLEIEVGGGSEATRRELRDLPTPRPTLIVSVVRDNTAMMPSAEFKFCENDLVVALTTSPNVANLVHLFERPR